MNFQQIALLIVLSKVAIGEPTFISIKNVQLFNVLYVCSQQLFICSDQNIQYIDQRLRRHNAIQKVHER